MEWLIVVFLFVFVIGVGIAIRLFFIDYHEDDINDELLIDNEYLASFYNDNTNDFRSV